MTKQRLKEIKITNQVLATLVVILSLSSGYFLAKDKGWLSKKPDPVVVAKREYQDKIYQIDIPAYYQSEVINTISQRRTRRQFLNTPLTTDELSKLTWSLQGITADWGGRVVPTLKSSYPLEITLVIRDVEGIDAGIYHYLSKENQIKQISNNIPEYLNQMGEKIPSIAESPMLYVISANPSKIYDKLSESETPNPYLYLEAGHASQNLFLVAQSLGLGVNVISQFESELVKDALLLPEIEVPILLLPVGYPKEI